MDTPLVYPALVGNNSLTVHVMLLSKRRVRNRPRTWRVKLIHYSRGSKTLQSNNATTCSILSLGPPLLNISVLMVISSWTLCILKSRR